MSRETCPYNTLEDTAFWSRSVAGVEFVDPAVKMPFSIERTDLISTAGSCFAQHIARYLKQSGYNYFVPEDAPSWFLVPESVKREFNYGVFSARYGNIYTTRQLLQLLLKINGLFTPSDDVWEEDGRYLDPYRPAVQPGGFESKLALERDREQHFAAVRRMFKESNIFIFTLGLTEAWANKYDGAIYPVCPGCGVGKFSENNHFFVNFDYNDVVADLNRSLKIIREVNPDIKVILTVSPVPLVATATGKHVLSATTYSKSVLRAAAEAVSRAHERVAYFPSYEIITGSYSRGRFFGEDLRSVTEDGVRTVMSVFFKHFCEAQPQFTASSAPPQGYEQAMAGAKAAAVTCEEEMLEAKEATAS